ncbi:MAG: DUF1343 domain-containing protein [Bacteroidales bacterium]|nr:DUF1343 domain-containing protein [Bacteroidales bacterium]
MKKLLLLIHFVLCIIAVSAQNDYEDTVHPFINERSLIKGNERFDVYVPLLENKRIGVVCNHTSIVCNKTHLIDTLLTYKINIKTILTPEHGFKGSEEAGKLINGLNYYKDTIKIISLYGKNKKPTAEQINDIDIIIFDLQDVGCRFYTYISTLEYVMAACIENNKQLIVLDRPNPNNFVAGPVLKNNCKSFVGMQNIPVCYGLTIGEYANMINKENLVKANQCCELSIIPMLNYNRDSIYSLDVAPSPNLQTMQAIRNYPTLCLFEGTPVSVGRGTQDPFEIIGFPAYDKYSKSDKHNGSNNIISFTPKSLKGIAENPPFKDKLCTGRRISIDTNEIVLEYVIDMYKIYPDKSNFFTPMFDLLTGDTEMKKQIIAGKTAQQIRMSWNKEINEYENVRKKYIMY